MKPRLLVITHLFGYPWDPARGIFNQQQFDRLAERSELTVLVAVPWTIALRRPKQYLRAAREGATRWPYVRYFISLHLPLFGRSLNAALFLASLVIARWPLLRQRWDCLIGSWVFPDAVAVTALGRLLRIPVIAKAHGSDVNVYTRTLLRRIQIRWALRRCAAVMCPSRALAARLTEIGIPGDRLHTIPNGVDLAIMHRIAPDLARRELDVPQDARLILYVGNLLESKGCGDLFSAFLKVTELEPRALLVYVGAGPLRGRIEKDADAAGLSARVRFAGRLPHDRLNQWYSAADLLCLPSHAEGMPNVVLEALACGTPVVATPVGGIPDVLGERTGALSPVGDPQALSRAIIETLHRDWTPELLQSHVATLDWDGNLRRVMTLVGKAAGESARLATPA
jgi:glycosyltransferase involved in cell wall biosynthesis